MIGAVILIVALLLFPIALLMSSAVVGAVIGWKLKDTAESDHEGSELIELNG